MSTPAKGLLVLAIIALAVTIIFSFPSEKPVFPDLVGPATATPLPVVGPATSPASYQQNGRHALAIWLRDEESSWIGLVHGLSSIGVPVRVVDNIDAALEHQVIIIYPTLTGSNTTPASLKAIANHVRGGGTILAFSVIGGGMSDVFGFTETEERSGEPVLTFSQSAFNEKFLNTGDDRRLNLSSASGQGLPVTAYKGLKHEPVAAFDDGGAAITQNYFGDASRRGHAYAIALDVGHFARRAFNGRFSGQAGHYVNTYRPGVDLLLRFMKAAYEQGNTQAITVSPTPFNREVTILVTHDVDFTQSMENIPAYAAVEKKLNVPATYFVQAKYVTDYYDKYFLTPEREDILKNLVADGMEVASHTVSHSNELRSMPLGTGQEMYPDYYPFVKSFTKVFGASVLGELRVSAFLLEHLSGEKVVSFRPGHLSLPEQLPEALLAAGYSNSSSLSANEALTHLPYHTMFSRGYRETLDILEFPVTFEDEKWQLADNLEEVVKVTEQIAEYRGLVNLLVHTEELGTKLDFVRDYIKIFHQRAWFSTMADYADWWRARYSLRMNVTDDGNLEMTVDRPVEGLTLKLPADWKLRDGPEGSYQEGRHVVVGLFDQRTTLIFE